jgi:hypothetical protein
MSIVDGNQVRLVIDADKPQCMTGMADFGAAITDNTTSLSRDIASALKNHGYSRCILVLDAAENLEAPEKAAAIQKEMNEDMMKICFKSQTTDLPTN